MYWQDTWFNTERYEYLINWLSTDTLIMSYPTPKHPAYIALKAWALELPEVIVPYLMRELCFKDRWGVVRGGSHCCHGGRANLAVMSILAETMPDAPEVPDEIRGKYEPIKKLWHDWYNDHLILDEHNMEKYIHKDIIRAL